MNQPEAIHDRSTDEKFADSLDCDLYKVVTRCEGRADKHWQKVALALRNVRPLIRQRMHAKDREATI